MQASEKALDAAVATRLARTVERHPEHLGLLVDYVRDRLTDNAAGLIQIAQQGEGAMGRALAQCIGECEDQAVLEAVFNALPVRTVQLRELAIAVATKLAASANARATGPANLVLRSQVGARLREGGQPDAALAVLSELVQSQEFETAPTSVQAHALANLGTALADLARDDESMQAHVRALSLLRPTPSHPVPQDTVHLLASEFANAAAAAMRLRRNDEAGHLLDEGARWVDQADDKGLELRVNVLRLTHLAETDQLEEALALGRQLRERVSDLEEIDSQAYLPALVDVFVNVGSILLDLNRADDALSCLRSADQVARKIYLQAPAPQSRLKCITARIALLNALLVLGTQGVSARARDLLQESTDALRLHPSAYVQEVHARALQIAVQSATDEEGERPEPGIIAEMLAIDRAASGTSGQFDPDRLLRSLHVAAMAYAKLEADDLALQCAQRALAMAESRQPGETMHERAHRAVLTDSLSRRLYAIGSDGAGLDAAEAAARLLIPCWRERPEAYLEWLQRMLGRFEMLCNESHDPGRFKRLVEEELEDPDPAAT